MEALIAFVIAMMTTIRVFIGRLGELAGLVGAKLVALKVRILQKRQE